MKTIYQLRQIQQNITAIKAQLDAVDWSGLAGLDDVGAHLVALEAHLDNAQGRAGTLMQSVAQKSIVIFKRTTSAPGGKAYLTAAGYLSSERSDAAVHWLSQFDGIVAENWIVQPSEGQTTEWELV
jgi:hypothetical protein